MGYELTFILFKFKIRYKSQNSKETEISRFLSV
jgi:hypothetical protein